MYTPTCSRCGTCCRKGGPLLHKQDMSLIVRGILPLTHLLTLRAGEWAHDPTTESLQALKSEVIKIKGTGEQKFPWHCVLHKDESCHLHPKRPAQCAALFCQDTSTIKDMYAHERLTREDILQEALSGTEASTRKAWSELIRIHETECSVEGLTQMLNQAEHEQVEHMLRYDAHFRELCAERAQIGGDMMFFLFGRPLASVLHSLQAALRHKKNQA